MRLVIGEDNALLKDGLIRLLEASYAENAAFTHTIVSLADRQKAAVFLDF